MLSPADPVTVRQAILDLFRDRRSHRDYLPDPVPADALRTVLEAARWAPSGENAQPWRFIVVTKAEARTRLGAIARRGSGRRFTGEFVTRTLHHRFSGLEDPEKQRRVFEKLTTGQVSAFVADAPVLVVVVGQKDVWDTPFDCSAAIQNMLLAATAIGLGSCWVNAGTLDIRDEREIKILLQIPVDYKVVSLVSFGYPSREIKPRRRQPLSSLVFGDVYGQPYRELGGEDL